MFRRRIIQIIILLILILSISTVLYYKYESTLKTTAKSLNDRVIAYHIETFKKLSSIFLKETNDDFIKQVEKDKELRRRFEDMLSLIRISTVQNLFVVAKNKNGHYYFLLDSEQNPKLRANLYEPFQPLGESWEKSCQLKRCIIFHHKKDTNLWITIVYPIVQNNKIIAFIAADISHMLDSNMQNNLQEFTLFFLWTLILSVLLFSLFYIALLYFRKKSQEGYIDPLTKVYNRKYLNEILMKKLARSYQLFMIDIDFFKKVNDTYGHNMGDLVLQEVAQRMNALMRAEDVLIRFGGEEFIVYTKILTQEKSFAFAQRIRKSIEEKPFVNEDVSCNVTISIGICSNEENNQFDFVLQKADEALYKAKESGRNCVQLCE